MAGSQFVVANMYRWVGASVAASRAAMDSHIQKSEQYAKTTHPWSNQTGGTVGDVFSQTTKDGARIVSYVGYKSWPKTGDGNSKGWWLENPRGTVRAYGRGALFRARFRNLETARSHNVEALIRQLQKIYSRGGVTFHGAFGKGVGHL